MRDNMWQGCSWLNEPRQWSAEGDVLCATTGAGTDFWRETHYGYTHDSGHFYGRRVDGDFAATLRVRGAYKTLYDQAGLMVRIDEAHWVKAGAELWEGRAVSGSVLTDGRSDWAVGPTIGRPEEFRLSVSVREGVLRLEIDGALLRLAPFPRADAYLVGPMCCSPTRAGLDVTFDAFAIEALHA